MAKYEPCLIEMAFREDMEAAILEGRKVATTRRHRKGLVGDIFLINGRPFRIIGIKKRTLEYICNQFFDLDGCRDSAQFEQLWRSLHNGEFDGTNMHHIHFFAPVLRASPDVQRLLGRV